MVAKAIIVGHIGKKESKVVKGDKQLVILSIATNTSHKNDMGEKIEVTSWHYVNCFGKIAEIVEKYTNVGDRIYIEGDISHKKVTLIDKHKWIYAIQATQVELMGNKRSDNVEKASPVNDDFDLDIPF